MVTKRHMLITLMAGASSIMGSAMQARMGSFSEMMKEMERHEQEMRHFFDDMYSSFGRLENDKNELDASVMAITINPEKDAVKVTVSAIDADAIEASKNKEGTVLTIKDKQGALVIELSLEHKNFLAVRARQDSLVEKEEKPVAAQEKEPKGKEAQKQEAPVKMKSHALYSTAFGQWLPERVDLGAATIELARKEKMLTISIPKVSNANEAVPVTVK